MTTRGFAGALAVILGLAAASPARADDGATVHATPGLQAASSWRSPDCATGEITDHLVQREADGTVTIQLDGWSEMCGPHLGGPGITYQFGLILYRSDTAWLGRLTRYQGHTQFSYVVDYTAATEALGGPPSALCLAYAPDNRLSCVHVNSFSTADPPTVGVISPDDSRVGRPPDGECPSCLR